MALLDALKPKEKASEAMAEAEEAIRDAVDIAMQDAPVIDERFTDSKVISRLVSVYTRASSRSSVPFAKGRGRGITDWLARCPRALARPLVHLTR